MGTIYNSEGIDEAMKSPYDFPSIFLPIWNVSVVWQREQHYLRGGAMFFEPWVPHRSRISASIATHLCSDVLYMKCVDF